MKKRFSLIFLLALAPSLVTARSPAPPVPEAPATSAGPKTTKLELSPGATRDEIKALLKQHGLPDNDQQVDTIMATLAAAKRTPAPATPAEASAPKPTQLDLPPNATRDEIKAILRKQGLSDNDKQVDGIMAKLAVAKGQSTGLHGFVKNSLPGMDLEYIPLSNQYHAKGQVNDQPASFIIDSGAHDSMLSTDLCERIGLKTEQTGTGTGIGGNEATFATQIDSMQIGPHIKLGAQRLKAAGMNRTKEEGNVSDGLIGADVLTRIGGVIDYRTHRLAYPEANNQVDLSAVAKASGFEEIVMKKCGLYSVLEATIKGQPVRFVIDTAAQQSVLDAAFAKRLGLPLIPSSVLIQGFGAKQQAAELTSLDDVSVGGNVNLSRMPMLVMPLGHVQSTKDEDHFDGILGAEFLFAAGAVFDTGNQKLYIEPGLIDVRNHIKTGAEMFGSDEELKQAIATSPRVLAGKIKTIGVLDQSTTDAKGTVWKVVQIEAVINETLKGEAVPAGTAELIHVLVKDEPDLVHQLSGRLGRNPSKIFFLGEKSDGKKATATAAEHVIWTDGELPRAQLKRVGVGQ